MIWRLAVRLPVAFGEKVTLIVQLAPVGRVVPQVFVWVKSPAFTPVRVIPLIGNAAPRFVTVIVEGLLVVPTLRLPNPREFGEKDTDVEPVPLRFTV